jgi:hypothetical protein
VAGALPAVLFEVSGGVHGVCSLGDEGVMGFWSCVSYANCHFFSRNLEIRKPSGLL